MGGRVAVAASVPENRQNLKSRLVRIAMVERAGKFMGKEALADASGIPTRTMRSYATAERGMPDLALRMTARALRRHAELAIEQAERIEAMLAGDAQ